MSTDFLTLLIPRFATANGDDHADLRQLVLVAVPHGDDPTVLDAYGVDPAHVDPITDDYVFSITIPRAGFGGLSQELLDGVLPLNGDGAPALESIDNPGDKPPGSGPKPLIFAIADAVVQTDNVAGNYLA